MKTKVKVMVYNEGGKLIFYGIPDEHKAHTQGSQPMTPTVAFWVLLVAGLILLLRGVPSTVIVFEGGGFKVTTDQVGLILIVLAVVILLAAMVKGKAGAWILYRD